MTITYTPEVALFAISQHIARWIKMERAGRTAEAQGAHLRAYADYNIAY